ncbi:MAG: hypothetical protein COC21_02610, partial [Verrucomicrobiales bacterium]
TPLWLRFTKGGEVKQIPIRRAKDGGVTVDVQWDELPGQAAIESSQLDAVTAWLAAPSNVRPDTLPGDWDKGDLSKSDAKKVIDLLWADHCKSLAKRRLQATIGRAPSPKPAVQRLPIFCNSRTVPACGSCRPAGE